jgi:hypothetical protein
LLATFGLSRDTLTAENVIIPISYYVRKFRLPDQYLTAPSKHDDRELVRSWVVRSLLRSGFWTGAVDTILIETRNVIREHAKLGGTGFPGAAIEAALEAKNKSLRFTEGEIEELLKASYKSPRSMLLLSLLYGDAVRRNAFHTDHVYPRARLRTGAIEAALLACGRAEPASLWTERIDQLPNLQLLSAAENTTKSELMPVEWAEAQLPISHRNLRLAEADLSPLPPDVPAWFKWWERRQKLQEARLRALVAVEASPSADAPAATF